MIIYSYKFYNKSTREEIEIFAPTEAIALLELADFISFPERFSLIN